MSAEDSKKKVERFEELIAWQKSRELTKRVYDATRRGIFAKDFGLSGQIQRAVVSIMSNIAEGFERGGRANFISIFPLQRHRVRRSVLSCM